MTKHRLTFTGCETEDGWQMDSNEECSSEFLYMSAILATKMTAEKLNMTPQEVLQMMTRYLKAYGGKIQ